MHVNGGLRCGHWALYRLERSSSKRNDRSFHSERQPRLEQFRMWPKTESVIDKRTARHWLLTLKCSRMKTAVFAILCLMF